MTKNGTVDDGSRPSLDEVTETVRSLVEIMRANSLTELDVEVASVAIRLRGPKGGGRGKSHVPTDVSQTLLTAPPSEPSAHIVTAPMIGTYYSSPAPGEPPFVRIGDVVQAGQAIGIIEAMKIMNEIVTDRSGIVVDILVANAQAVEYGSPLLRLDTVGESGE